MKKIIDDRGRVFGLISLVDVIVIVAVAVLAVVVFMRLNAPDSPLASSNTVNVTYTVMVPAIRLFTAEQILPGDNLYTDMGTYIGTIKAVTWEDAYSMEPLVDGTLVLGRVHERYDAILTVEAQCSTSDGRYFANRVFELNANSEQRLQTKYNIFMSFITSVTPG